MTTPYVAHGQGPTAIFLSPDLRDGATDDNWGHRFRVVAPVIPVDRDPVSLTVWLDGFLDGLGLGRVLLVVDPRIASFARAYAAGSPGRVRDVVSFTAGDIDLPVAPGSLGA
jgi:hypothetical protein